MTAQPAKFGLKLSVKLYVTYNYSSMQMYVKKNDVFNKKCFFNKFSRIYTNKKSLKSF